MVILGDQLMVKDIEEIFGGFDVFLLLCNVIVIVGWQWGFYVVEFYKSYVNCW